MGPNERRILTTHVGSLIRPASLLPFLSAKGAGKPYDQAAYAQTLKREVAEVVAKQAEIGIDIVSDGEFGKALSWSLYGLLRLNGFERREGQAGQTTFGRGIDRKLFPEFYKELDSLERPAEVSSQPDYKTIDAVCVSPIGYSDAGIREVHTDISNLKAALAQHPKLHGFLPVASTPSVIPDRKNEYYASDDDCARAVASAMHTEYKAITDAGLFVQLDDARIAVTHDRMLEQGTFADYRKWVGRSVEIINESIKGLPWQQIRYHVCWGSWAGPHVGDVPFRSIVDLVMRIKAGAFAVEMANVRHEHEWRIWEKQKLPDGVKLIPGVISHQTNVVEHPELVCERIVRLTNLVGRENVIAGTDCGFAQATYLRRVHPSIQWAKLRTLVEGAGLASKILWRRKSPARRAKAKRNAAR
jgi:5-methyltetrahydropteroyltriglutamate--homocysteine methyltransferase